MREDGQPFLGQGGCVVALAARDRLHWVEVIRHDPCEINVRGGWDEVRDVARRLSAASHHDALHIGGVPWEDLHGNPRDNFLVAAQQLHMPRCDQRIVIRADVADGVTLQLQSPVLPLALGSVIRRFGKRRDDLIALPDRVPAAMVEVQMRVNDDVDVFWSDARCRELV